MGGNKRNEIAVFPLVKLKPGIVPGINEQTNKQRNEERQKGRKLTDFWLLTLVRPFFEKNLRVYTFANGLSTTISRVLTFAIEE